MNGKIRVTAGRIVQDNTITAEMAAGVLHHLEGEYLVKVKFVREQAPDVWVVEDGFAKRVELMVVESLKSQAGPIPVR